MTYKLTIWAESRYDEKAPADTEHMRKLAERFAQMAGEYLAGVPDFKLHFTVEDYDGKLSD